MKYVKFKEAQAFLGMPGGPVPFYREGRTVIVKVELTPGEIEKIAKSGNAIYIAVGPVNPSINPPIPLVLIDTPFVNPSDNGQAIKND